jgi:CDP-2,3-bis-(O-geranylgeranyl)-sn-glycerol synthase
MALNAVVARTVQLVYLMAPAYVANMAPPFTRFWPGWNRPISERWLGSHKTVLGAAAGVATSVIVAFVQARIAWTGSIADYNRWLPLGVLLGAGAMGGDALKSFFKRRRGIPAGARWVPADQLDFALGALILVRIMVPLSWVDAAVTLALTFVGDIVVNQLAFRLRVRETAW